MEVKQILIHANAITGCTSYYCMYCIVLMCGIRYNICCAGLTIRDHNGNKFITLLCHPAPEQIKSNQINWNLGQLNICVYIDQLGININTRNCTYLILFQLTSTFTHHIEVDLQSLRETNWVDLQGLVPKRSVFWTFLNFNGHFICNLIMEMVFCWYTDSKNYKEW